MDSIHWAEFIEFYSLSYIQWQCHCDIQHDYPIMINILLIIVASPHRYIVTWPDYHLALPSAADDLSDRFYPKLTITVRIKVTFKCNILQNILNETITVKCFKWNFPNQMLSTEMLLDAFTISVWAVWKDSEWCSKLLFALSVLVYMENVRLSYCRSFESFWETFSFVQVDYRKSVAALRSPWHH